MHNSERNSGRDAERNSGRAAEGSGRTNNLGRGIGSSGLLGFSELLGGSVEDDGDNDDEDEDDDNLLFSLVVSCLKGKLSEKGLEGLNGGDKVWERGGGGVEGRRGE